MRRFPAHVVVVDQLRVGQLFARRVECKVDYCLGATHRAAQTGLYGRSGVMVDGFVHDVPAPNLAAIASGDFVDMIDQQPLRLAGRACTEIVAVEPAGKPFGPVPEQNVRAQVKRVRFCPGGNRIHGAKVEPVGRGADGLPFQFVFGNDDTALGTHDVGVTRIGNRHSPTLAVPRNRAAEAAPAAPGQSIEAGRGCGDARTSHASRAPGQWQACQTAKNRTPRCAGHRH